MAIRRAPSPVSSILMMIALFALMMVTNEAATPARSPAPSPSTPGHGPPPPPPPSAAVGFSPHLFISTSAAFLTFHYFGS